VFQKSYTGNILEIGRNKFRNSYFSRTEDEDQTGAGEGPEAGHTDADGVDIDHRSVGNPKRNV
jgi:hypothetical protein